MTNTDSGRSPDGSGYSAEPEPSCTVSAVPVSIPNAERPSLAKRILIDGLVAGAFVGGATMALFLVFVSITSEVCS